MPALALLLATGLATAPVQAPRARSYAGADGSPHAVYVFQPEGRATLRRPAILLFHPGGWRAGSAAWEFDDARRFAALGLVALAVDYRLATKNVGPDASLADACAAFAWTRAHARELGIDATLVAGYGESAGGQLVAGAGAGLCPAAVGHAAHAGPDLMVLVSPVLDTRQAIYADLLATPGRADDYSPLAHAAATRAPTLLVQGDADNVAPASTAHAYCTRVRRAGGECRLAVYPGLGHLLTRNLARQEEDIDPAPAALADAQARQRRFLASHGFTPPTHGKARQP